MARLSLRKHVLYNSSMSLVCALAAIIFLTLKTSYLFAMISVILGAIHSFFALLACWRHHEK